jgi:hypothetical protein
MKYQPPKKMTSPQIQVAVLEYERGDSLAILAARYGVTRQSMWDLLRRRTTLRPHLRYGEENHFYRGGATASAHAHNKVEKAVLRGRLARPATCQECGGSGQPYADGRAPIQAHHPDYNKPLEVMWLCQRCHHKWHARNRAIPEKVG